MICREVDTSSFPEGRCPIWRGVLKETMHQIAEDGWTAQKETKDECQGHVAVRRSLVEFSLPEYGRMRDSSFTAVCLHFEHCSNLQANVAVNPPADNTFERI